MLSLYLVNPTAGLRVHTFNSKIIKIESPESLWNKKGYCGGSAIIYFHGLLLQALYLKSVAKKVKGSELDDNEYDDFMDDVKKINSNYEAKCYSRLLKLLFDLVSVVVITQI